MRFGDGVDDGGDVFDDVDASFRGGTVNIWWLLVEVKEEKEVEWWCTVVIVSVSVGGGECWVSSTLWEGGKGGILDAGGD